MAPRRKKQKIVVDGGGLAVSKEPQAEIDFGLVDEVALPKDDWKDNLSLRRKTYVIPREEAFQNGTESSAMNDLQMEHCSIAEERDRRRTYVIDRIPNIHEKDGWASKDPVLEMRDSEGMITGMEMQQSVQEVQKSNNQAANTKKRGRKKKNLDVHNDSETTENNQNQEEEEVQNLNNLSEKAKPKKRGQKKKASTKNSALFTATSHEGTIQQHGPNGICDVAFTTEEKKLTGKPEGEGETINEFTAELPKKPAKRGRKKKTQ